MAYDRDDSYEELIWSSADAVREVDPVYIAIHENTVLPYFAKSPFFSNASKNKILLDQANLEIIQDREHFEAALRSQPGLEYVVAYGPKDFGGYEAPMNMGRWVIRKQMRSRSQDRRDWDVQLLDTYFVIGQAVCHSPRLADVLWTRLISAGSAIKRLLDISSDLASYSPALGYHYVSPNLKSSAAQHSSFTTGGSSVINSPALAPDREATPLPGSNADQRESSRVPASGAATSAPSNHGDLGTLAESFNQFLKYGNEYMDENPLVGEPGSFSFTTTRQTLQARNEAAKKTQDAAAKSKPATPRLSTTAPPKLDETKPVLDQNKPKPKRRKSRAPTSPSSPLAVPSPSAVIEL